MSTGWEPADGWVLASIGVYQRRCSLLEVIAAGDWMNHAVLEEREVAGALTRLVGAGLVRIFEDWTFELTDDGASMFSAELRSIQQQLEVIDTALSGMEPIRAKIVLPRGLMDQALAEYREHVAEETR